jgi:transcriptional regulator with XRE-family HTH domain
MCARDNRTVDSMPYGNQNYAMTMNSVTAVTPLTESVAEEIRVALARRRMRQSHLARQLGTSDQWLSIRLRGIQPIDLNDLQRIAAALGVSVVDLIPAGERDAAGEPIDRKVRNLVRLSAAQPSGQRRPIENRPPGRSTNPGKSASPRRPVRMRPPSVSPNRDDLAT